MKILYKLYYRRKIKVYFRFDKNTHEFITENGASVGLVSTQTDVTTATQTY